MRVLIENYNHHLVNFTSGADKFLLRSSSRRLSRFTSHTVIIFREGFDNHVHENVFLMYAKLKVFFFFFLDLILSLQKQTD